MRRAPDFPRSHAPRGNAVPGAPRLSEPGGHRRGASRTAFPRGAWERVVSVALGLVMLTPTLASAQKPAPVENVSSFEPRTPADERKALHVPDGFEVQLVAAE